MNTSITHSGIHGMKVKVMFDPPASSFALDALNKQIQEFEWRIIAENEAGDA